MPESQPEMTPFLRYASWPLLLLGAIALTELGRRWLGLPLVAVAGGVYLLFALAIFFLERRLPFEPRWLEDDGHMPADLAHTLLNKGSVEILLMLAGVLGLAELIASDGSGPWPADWPLVLQVALGLVVAEAGLYVAHRLGHEIPLLWRVHAVHHSVTRLWFFNTGRFHVIDTVKSIALSQPLLYLAGAPLEVFQWVGLFTAYVGMLTHCNVDMRVGPLNYVFNSPQLHRWHHSMDAREGNRNYGENLMLYDLLFATFFLPDRRPPATIGIREPMPASFLGQLAQPFRRAA